MRPKWIALGLVSAAVLWAGAEAEACGDKFLVIGRGVKRVPKARHPGSVLIYMTAGSNMKAAARELKLEVSLKQAGHRLQVVEDAARFEEALRSGGFDLVLADLSDVGAIDAGARALPSRPEVLPVVYKPSAAERASAEGQHGRVITAPGKGTSFLGVIDDAIGTRHKNSPGSQQR